MTTLHLQVPINDLPAWKAGYADNTETRRNAGVRSETVRHPVGDESLVVVDLEFDGVPQAEAFLGFLKERIWNDQPILAGTPKASILESVDVS
jgi:hypothetical protein